MPRPIHCRRRALIATMGAAALLCMCLTTAVTAGPNAMGAAFGATQAQLALTARCPWATASGAAHSSPSALAAEVVARMTLSEKLGLVDLANANGYENQNMGIPRLCIPALTLQDSPNGLANGVTQVTQLPASLGIAASFDTALAYQYGQVLGQEARGKGIDVVQGPELNLDRVPESGRAFEAYGEDPYLTAALGVANIEGIQSEGIMADAKHYSAYNQETARFLVDQVISARALAEIYQVPFEAAVKQGHVATMMCSYGSLNGVNACSSPYLYQALKSWGFAGFVRSDLDAVEAAVPAFAAGMSVIKPAVVTTLRDAVLNGHLGVGRLNDAVQRVLTEMFAFGMVQNPPSGNINADVATPAHASFARQAAESSMVLLRDKDNVLPLDAKALASVAVIGLDAGASTMSAGYGSSRVKANYVVTPLAALKVALGPKVKVTYADGGGASLVQREVPASWLVAPVALKPGPEPPELTGADPQGIADLQAIRAPSVSAQSATAGAPGTGKYWSTWVATLTPRQSGLFTVSLTQSGDTWLYIDGKVVMASPGLHAPGPWSTSVALTAGKHYALRLDWFMALPETEPSLGLAYQSDDIATAVSAARAAQVAVVFANDFTSEAFDRLNLSLPGDQDALIEAVAAANPRTVVVLNTAGPVLMPWVNKVAGIVEAWYPGQEDGNAIAAILTGLVDPSGHLPVTFPATAGQGPVRSQAQWPGENGKVLYSEGLDIGYRYYNDHNLRPLFPFGFGLSYTSFLLSNASVSTKGTVATVGVWVTNTGARSGTAVVQAYLSYPAAAGEPPAQLRAFTRATLGPGQSKVVTMDLPGSDFEAYLGGHFVTVRGTYTVELGQSSENLPLQLSLTAPL
jgi:beta-glucosidase